MVQRTEQEDDEASRRLADEEIEQVHRSMYSLKARTRVGTPLDLTSACMVDRPETRHRAQAGLCAIPGCQAERVSRYFSLCTSTVCGYYARHLRLCLCLCEVCAPAFHHWSFLTTGRLPWHASPARIPSQPPSARPVYTAVVNWQSTGAGASSAAKNHISDLGRATCVSFLFLRSNLRLQTAPDSI